MTLLGRKRQLERADLITQIEQGRRVEQELFQENTRSLRTMGELLKARVFGSTLWAQSLRKRMTNHVQGASTTPPAMAGNAWVRGHAPPEPHSDLDAEEGA
jgi:hypothetical protein